MNSAQYFSNGYLMFLVGKKLVQFNLSIHYLITNVKIFYNYLFILLFYFTKILYIVSVNIAGAIIVHKIVCNIIEPIKSLGNGYSFIVYSKITCLPAIFKEYYWYLIIFFNIFYLFSVIIMKIIILVKVH